MFTLTEKRLVDFIRHHAETGMGYVVVTAVLKDGREFPQTLIDSGHVTRTRYHSTVPFLEVD